MLAVQQQLLGMQSKGNLPLKFNCVPMQSQASLLHLQDDLKSGLAKN